MTPTWVRMALIFILVPSQMKQIPSAFLIITLLSISCAYGEAQPNIVGVGSVAFDFLYEYWNFAFNLIETSTTIEYEVASPGTELSQLQKDPAVKFATVCVTSTASLSNNTDLDFFPVFAAPIVPIYNVNLEWDDPKKVGTPTLTLSRETLADIYRGRISTWSDERIANDNPNVILPNTTIWVWYRADATIINYAWLTAMNSFVPDWEYGTNYTWNANYTQAWVWFRIGITGEGVLPAVAGVPDSIGYTTYGTYIDQHQDGVNYARIVNRGGLVAEAEPDQVQAGLDTITADESPIVFTDRQEGWPIMTVAYQAIKKNACANRRELFKFFHWIKVSKTAIDRLEFLGGTQLGSYLESWTINYLESSTCDGVKLLEHLPVEQHAVKAFPALLSIAMILIVVAIILGSVWQYTNSSRCTKEVILYQFIQLLGIIITYVSVIFWYLVPNNDAICALRLWLTCMGFTLVFAAMFERTFRIHRIYGKVFKKHQLAGNFTSLLEVGGGVAIILIGQILLLVIWIGVDPYHSVFAPVNDVSFESRYECHMNNPNLWLALEVSYFGILLIWGVYVVYSTWALKNSILESRWILVSMYNNLLLLALLATMIPIVNLNDDLLFEIIVPLILLANTNVLIAVYIPAVLRKLSLLVSTSGETKPSETDLSVRSQSQH